MPALTLATLTMLAPRGRDDYLAHLAGPGKAELDKAGILQSKLRLCHFLAQIAHESGGFTVKEESLNYKTSKRLMQGLAQALPHGRLDQAFPWAANQAWRQGLWRPHGQ